MKKVLIPTNFLEDPERVIKGVIVFLKDVSGVCHCLLLNTYMVPAASSEEIVRVNDELKRKSLDGLKQLLESATAISPGGRIHFDISSQIGAPINVIPRLVQEQGIDWVMIGKDGNSGKETIASLLNRLNCPVVVIP